MHMRKSPNRNPDAIHLHDDADEFMRSRARTYRRHIKQMERRVRSGEISIIEAKRLRESMADDERKAQYWEAKAKNYEPSF